MGALGTPIILIVSSVKKQVVPVIMNDFVDQGIISSAGVNFKQKGAKLKVFQPRSQSARGRVKQLSSKPNKDNSFINRVLEHQR